MKRSLFVLSLLALLLVAACGSVGAGSGGTDAGPGDHTDDSDASPGDHTDDADAAPGDPDGPTVLSVSPEDGATGVAGDAVITLVFSRAMDRDSVKAAWSSEELPVGEVAFTWNQAGDTLTVTPDATLPMAEGSGEDPDAVVARTFAFAIGTGATDTDGLRLAAAFDAGFATLRRLELEVPYHAPLSDCRYSDGSATVGDEVLYAGDDSDTRQIKMVVSFALPELPADAVIQRAIFLSDQRGTTPGEDVYQDLGDLRLAHVRFTTLSTSFTAAALGIQNLLSDDDAPGPRSVTVTRAIADDFADDRTYAQFRAEFPTATDGDSLGDIAAFERPDFALSLTYLVE